MTLATMEAIVKHWAAFIKAHEKLALILGTLAIVAFLGHKAITAYDNHLVRQDTALVEADKAKLDAVTADNKKLVEQLAVLDAEVAALTKQGKQTIIIKHEEAVKQKQIDQNLPLPQLAVRWNLLINLSGAAATETGITVSPEAAHKTVDMLESIPDLQAHADIMDNIQAADAREIEQQKGVIASDAIVLESERKLHTDDVKKLSDDLKVEKRKSFWKGFKYGAGITAGVVVVAAVFIIAH